jgi:preprotein translocase subunit SecE
VQIEKSMAGIVNFVSESYDELKNHVTWTSWPEAQRLTIVVVVFSILFSLAIWGVDTVFSSVIEQYFEWIKS